MTDEQGALLEIVRRLEQAWNNGDSVAWTAEFANDADFIHVLGGFFHGSRDIEHAHRTIFDTIYKGSNNHYEVEKVRLLRPDVAVVFIRDNREEPNRRVENCRLPEHDDYTRGCANAGGHAGQGAPIQGQYTGEVICGVRPIKAV